MKMGRSGQPAMDARIARRVDEMAQPMKPRLRRGPVVALICVILGGLLFFERHALLGLIVSRALGAVTGQAVSFDGFVLGPAQGVVTGLQVVTRDGEPLVAIRRLGVRYSLTDLILGGRHRFGLIAIDVDAPTLSVVRHSDGSYNLAAVGSLGGGSGGSATAGREAPLRFRVRVHDGTVRLIDRAPVAADLGEQRLAEIALAGNVVSDGRSTATGTAVVLGRQTALTGLARWPVELSGFVDVGRGLALARARAARFPLRGSIGFVQHSRAVRVDDGVLHGVDLSIFALNIGLNRPPQTHIGGRADLRDGRLTIGALQLPVRGLRGRLTLLDDSVSSTRLGGTLAGLPLVAAGTAFDRAAPTLRLGIATDGNLARLRRIFAFSASQPLEGRAHVETLLEAPVSDLLIRSELGVARGHYAKIPLADVAGRVDYHAGAVVLDAVHARYGAAAIALGGRFVLGGPAVDSAITIAASGPARTLPYAENIAPESTVHLLALITGAGRYRARGAIGLHGPGVSGSGTFAVDERGVGEFGPLRFERSDGSSLLAALRLERPASLSAAWVSARGYRVNVPPAASRLAGLTLPAFPPVAGVVDADLAGGGSPDFFALSGSVRAHDLRVAGLRLGSGNAELSGSLGDVRLQRVELTGPLGHFSGAGVAAGGGFALRGDYDGSLDRLVPLTGPQRAHGAVRGPVIALLDDHGIVVQSVRATLDHGSIRGVQIDAAAGTIAVRRSGFHVIVAAGSIAGRSAVARESQGAVAVSAPDLPSAALRGAGLPLEAGNISAYGIADLRGASPTFDGTIAVAAGRARGYPVSGDAQIDLDGSRAAIYAATGALGSTYGSIGGSIDGIGQRALVFNLDTRVPLGDLELLRGDLDLPVRHLEGSFSANLHVHGSGTRPFVDGRVEAPEGRFNGLAFRAAAARVRLDSHGVAAQAGTLTVGSTRASLAASVAGSAFAVSAASAQADLADFNDYFDAGDTLAGRGRFDLALQTSGGGTKSRGRLALQGLRYRDFLLGDVTAGWATTSGAIRGQARIASAAGTLAASAAIVPAAGNARDAFRNADYDVGATLQKIDLGRWLPAAGFTQPILGLVDARLTLRGHLPAIAVSVDGSLADATIAGLTVHDGQVRATSRGSRITILASSADLGFVQLAGTGQLGLGDRDPLAFDLRATSADVSQAIRRFVPQARGLDLAGALEADIRLSGTRAQPKVEGGFDLENARYGTFSVPRAIGALALAGSAVELRDADVEFRRGQAFVAGSLPLQLAPFGLGPPHAPLSFDVTARGVDLKQFEPLMPAGTTLGGTVDGRFGVEGSVDRPRLLGALAIAGGSYLSPFERAPIGQLDARLVFAGTSVALQALHADVGTGTLDANGQIGLPIGTGAHVRYAIDVRAKAAALDFPAYGRGTLDGRLRLTGDGGQPVLGGEVALRDAVIPVAAVYGSGGSGPAGGSGFALDPTLNVRATIGKNVRVHSSIVDIGVTGAADVTGSLHAPRLAGAFVATDGTVSSYNHIFRVVNATATFNPADGLLPTIEARATSRVANPDPDPSRNISGSANIIVSVSGTPDSNNLQVTYSSDPPYSQEQIVGLLLDVPALLGAVNFDLNGGQGRALLRGAPGETNVLLPPGVTPEAVSAISFNQEVFSLLNGQFTQRALTPVERVFEKVFGLSDLQFTVDYGGGIGYSLRRQIGKRNFYAFLSQTVTFPERANIGFELEPRAYQTINFSYYQQNGVTSLITNATPGEAFSSSTRRFTSVQPLGNRSGFSLNFNRRF